MTRVSKGEWKVSQKTAKLTKNGNLKLTDCHYRRVRIVKNGAEKFRTESKRCYTICEASPFRITRATDTPDFGFTKFYGVDASLFSFWGIMRECRKIDNQAVRAWVKQLPKTLQDFEQWEDAFASPCLILETSQRYEPETYRLKHFDPHSTRVKTYLRYMELLPYQKKLFSKFMNEEEKNKCRADRAWVAMNLETTDPHINDVISAVERMGEEDIWDFDPIKHRSLRVKNIGDQLKSIVRAQEVEDLKRWRGRNLWEKALEKLPPNVLRSMVWATDEETFIVDDTGEFLNLSYDLVAIEDDTAIKLAEKIGEEWLKYFDEMEIIRTVDQ